MKKKIAGTSLVILIVITIYGTGKWHWDKKMTETIDQIDFERSITKEIEEQTEVDRFQPEERTLTDMKIDFSVVFEEAYLEYENTINQLLADAEREYVTNVIGGEVESYELINTYQTHFLEAEQKWSESFWHAYKTLQDEMEAAGYYRDDALEFEIEFELRREQTTHAFLQALFMLEIGT